MRVSFSFSGDEFMARSAYPDVYAMISHQPALYLAISWPVAASAHQMDSSVYGGGSEVDSGHICLTTNA